VALARLALVFEALQRGELVEPFGAAGRIASPTAYWLVVLPGSRGRPEVDQFCAWVQQQAVLTRAAVGEA
jgi:LysR family glycine cleavage system transcriptional activator